jgi:Protein of unknown function (DUF2752)
VVAIVPAPLLSKEADSAPQILEALPVLTWWVRGVLLFLVLALAAVFALAIWIKPYDEEGAVRSTYPELGLPPCTFKYLTGQPCPSCGMTHSFVMLMHGDLMNSIRSNVVGTLLAVFCMALIPWSLASVYLQRPLFVLTIERTLTWVIVVFMTLVLVRWVIVLGWHAWERFN